MSTRSMILSFLFLLFVILGSQSVYIITEIERGVLLRFGKVEDPDIATGLHWKVPIMDEVRRFDGRVLTLDASAERFLTVEKKSMQVDSFAKWRIVDVSKYYTATSGDQMTAERLLAQRINEGLRNEFATRSLQEVVSGERDQLMLNLLEQLNSFMVASMGGEVVDVRVKRIDLPEEVSEPVYNRMRAEREREAKEHLAIGREQAEITRAEADREVTVIEANAYRDSEKIRGEGDAKATGIYAKAYGEDPEFYSFVRSLTAYKETFMGKEDMILMAPDSEFFRFFNQTKANK